MDAKVKESILRFYKTRCISNRDFLDDMQRVSRVCKCVENVSPETEILLLNQLISLFNVFGKDLGIVVELKSEPVFWATWYTLLEVLGVAVPDGPRDDAFKVLFRGILERNMNHAKILISIHGGW